PTIQDSGRDSLPRCQSFCLPARPAGTGDVKRRNLAQELLVVGLSFRRATSTDQLQPRIPHQRFRYLSGRKRYRLRSRQGKLEYHSYRTAEPAEHNVGNQEVVRSTALNGNTG